MTGKCHGCLTKLLEMARLIWSNDGMSRVEKQHWIFIIPGVIN